MCMKNFLLNKTPLLDARSPIEYQKGHIPGAISFPLFTDCERASVGCVYKKEGKNKAIQLGLSIVGPKLLSFVTQAEELCSNVKDVRLYCARGGMRSHSLAWLLQTAEFSCSVLEGGYKAYRNWVLQKFKKKYRFMVIGGLTGCGKTELLKELASSGEQIIDLEEIASHKGSSFGHLGNHLQPTCEHFENILATQLSLLNPDLPIWIEDESHLIGSCPIPKDIWEQMQTSSFVWLDSMKSERVQRLLCTYGSYKTEDLLASVKKLSKRLGAVSTKEVVEAIFQNKLESAIEMLLHYYDKAYLHSCQKHGRAAPRHLFHRSNPDLIKELKVMAYATALHCATNERKKA